MSTLKALKEKTEGFAAEEHMAIRMIYLAILMMSASLQVLAQASPNADPTLKETQEWLQGRLPGAVITSYVDRSPIRTSTTTARAEIVDVMWDKCTLNFTRRIQTSLVATSQYSNSSRDIEQTDRVKMSLSDMEPDIKVKEEQSAPWLPPPAATTTVHGFPYYSMEIKTTSGRPLIAISSSYSWDEPKKDKQFNNYKISTSAREDAERIAKAISHAINLCGGKKALF